MFGRHCFAFLTKKKKRGREGDILTKNDEIKKG
jgi:hypothetical protein